MTGPVIAFLTDFGTIDPFAGIMKGVIAGLAPQALAIDLSHNIPPGDIRRAAITLWQSVRFFPSGTIFLCVIDPGVGTSRRSVILQGRIGFIKSSHSYTFIGPDNGIFTFVSAEAKAWELRNPQYALPDASQTFHGRDVYAPAAAHAALGMPGESFGPEISELVRLPLPHMRQSEPHILEGEVLYADQFGNLLTSLGRFSEEGNALVLKPWLPGIEPAWYHHPSRLLLSNGRSLSFVRTFAEAPEDGCAALVGSTGLVEIVAKGQSAAKILQLPPGARLTMISEEVD